MTQPPSENDDSETVDLEELVARNEPLANLIRTLQRSNTWRDDPKAIAEDLSIALKARDTQSELGQAFDRYEEERRGREATEVTNLNRKDLAAEILSEIRADDNDE